MSHKPFNSHRETRDVVVEIEFQRPPQGDACFGSDVIRDCTVSFYLEPAESFEGYGVKPAEWVCYDVTCPDNDLSPDEIARAAELAHEKLRAYPDA